MTAPHASAAPMLAFYAGLAEVQRTLARAAGSSSRESADAFTETVDVQGAARQAKTLLAWLRASAAEPLARASVDAASLREVEWVDLMRQRLAQVGADGPLGFLVEALLQPFAEAAARRWIGRRIPLLAETADTARALPSGDGRLACCPVCGSAPVAAALREEGQGAKRTLICSLCFTEWDFLRVVCPACDEQRFESLPVYTAETIDHARIDACDTCRVYMKTVDLTKDGLAVPVVDDVATVPLDLWAREAGYQRLYPNLLRL